MKFTKGQAKKGPSFGVKSNQADFKKQKPKFNKKNLKNADLAESANNKSPNSVKGKMANNKPNLKAQNKKQNKGGQKPQNADEKQNKNAQAKKNKPNSPKANKPTPKFPAQNNSNAKAKKKEKNNSSQKPQALKRKPDSTSTNSTHKKVKVNLGVFTQDGKEVKNTDIIFPEKMESYNEIVKEVASFTSNHLAPERIHLQYDTEEEAKNAYYSLSKSLSKNCYLNFSGNMTSERYLYVGPNYNNKFLQDNFNPEIIEKRKKGICVLKFKSAESALEASKKTVMYNNEAIKLFEKLEQVSTFRKQFLAQNKGAPQQKKADTKEISKTKQANIAKEMKSVEKTEESEEEDLDEEEDEEMDEEMDEVEEEEEEDGDKEEEEDDDDDEEEDDDDNFDEEEDDEDDDDSSSFGALQLEKDDDEETDYD